MTDTNEPTVTLRIDGRSAENLISTIVDQVLHGVMLSGDDDDYYHRSGISKTINKIVNEKVDAQVAKLFDQTFSAAIEQTVKDRVESALTEGFTKTNTYGEPQGKVTIESEVRKALSETKRPNGRYDGPERSVVGHAIADLLEKEVANEVRKQVTAVVADAKAGIREQVARMAGQFLEEQLKKQVGGGA